MSAGSAADYRLAGGKSLALVGQMMFAILAAIFVGETLILVLLRRILGPASGDATRLLRIQEVAAETGLTTRAIRYYEELGLLEPAARSDGAYRLYDASDLERLRRIAAMFKEQIAAEIAMGNERAKEEWKQEWLQW